MGMQAVDLMLMVFVVVRGEVVVNMVFDLSRP